MPCFGPRAGRPGPPKPTEKGGSAVRAARERMDAMLPRMMEAAGVTEELKARDPMRWVGLMNTLKVQVEETIFQELIFQ